MYIWNITIYEPSPLGGSDVRPMRSAMLSQALCHAGHDVEMWMPGFEHVHHIHYRQESCFEKISDNYGIQYIKGCGYENDISLKRLLHNRQIARGFLRLAKERKELPDLLFTQVPSLELAEAVVKFSKINNLPVVIDIRDLWPDVYKRLFPQWCDFLYYLLFGRERCRARKLFSSATAITAVSKSYLEWGAEYANRQLGTRDKVFHIGYDSLNNTTVNRPTNSIRFNFEKQPDDLFISFVGTFCSSYNLFCVLQAAELLSRNGNSDIKFIIAGTGEKELLLHESTSHLRNIFFTGWLDTNNLQYLLSITDVGLAPYSKIAQMSLPNKPFEYMSASLPILTSLDGELRKLIEEKGIGIYYPAGDAEALVEAILSFRNNPDMRIEMGKRARQVFEAEFRSDLIYPKFADHLTMIATQQKESNTKYGRA